MNGRQPEIRARVTKTGYVYETKLIARLTQKSPRSKSLQALDVHLDDLVDTPRRLPFRLAEPLSFPPLDVSQPNIHDSLIQLGPRFSSDGILELV